MASAIYNPEVMQDLLEMQVQEQKEINLAKQLLASEEVVTLLERKDNPKGSILGLIHTLENTILLLQFRLSKVEQEIEEYKNPKPFVKSMFRQPVYQYTKDGKFVKQWKDLYQVKNILGINTHAIAEHLRKKLKGIESKSSQGFVWELNKR